jgi:enoyl-CoA hydratase/carnithine racemase
MWLNLRKIFQRLSIDPNVRAVVLSGAGRAFCAGLDVKVIMTTSRPEPGIETPFIRQRNVDVLLGGV